MIFARVAHDLLLLVDNGPFQLLAGEEAEVDVDPDMLPDGARGGVPCMVRGVELRLRHDEIEVMEVRP